MHLGGNEGSGAALLGRGEVRLAVVGVDAGGRLDKNCTGWLKRKGRKVSGDYSWWFPG